MNRKQSTAPLVAITLALALSAGTAWAQDVGVNAAIRNSVRIKTAADAAPRAARLRETVHIGDTITSGANSQLQVLLRDRSTFTVGSNARLVIDRFVYDPGRGTTAMAATVGKGAFRFMSGRPAPGGSRTITTPVASIGIRGTIVEGTVGPDTFNVLRNQPGMPSLSGPAGGATLVVLRGPGANNEGSDSTGAIDLQAGGASNSTEQPGQAFLVLNDGQTFGPFPISDDASERLTALLQAPAGGGAEDVPFDDAFDPTGLETPYSEEECHGQNCGSPGVP